MTGKAFRRALLRVARLRARVLRSLLPLPESFHCTRRFVGAGGAVGSNTKGVSLVNKLREYWGLALGISVTAVACWPLDVWHFIGAFIGVNILLLCYGKTGMTFKFTDRYKALGIPYPDPETMCNGPCEGTGWFPENDKTNPLWQVAHNAREHECDGWHFVRCPECDATGKRKL